MSDYNYKAVNRDMGRAIHHYEMIEADDRILVAVSGGKDSLTMLWMLSERLLRIPISYELYAVYIDPGFEKSFAPELAGWCRDLGVELRVEHTDHGPFAHSEQNSENPCFLCSRMRRKRIFEVADELGCGKIAMGHHKDDIIETLFINMCYTGVMSTMCPAQQMFEGRFTIIRPMAYVDEERIRRFATDTGFPEFNNPCPSANDSKRKEIKSLVNNLTRGKKKIKNNIFRSLSHVNIEYMLKQESRGG
ncbi:MAG: tRNA 2-thiocytidine(32) synthetase TtcA [Desulfobacteraceae bacterium]|nr:tRNA 2-thiocytidine(32) synthetase TtcA [Desulfobacteraceae bacterium]MCF8095851.1 tRNA 2-thiocytidine(32) synthetase TtcA [Desulfobacteraceae bacterium]